MSYSQALEQQIAMLRYVQTPEFLAKAQRTFPAFPMDALSLSTKLMLERAETYWCSDEIANLLTETSKSLPEDSTMNLSLLPSRNGFMWLQHPLVSKHGESVAVAWGYEDHLEVPEMDNFVRDAGPLVWTLWFVKTAAYPGFWPLIALPWLQGQTGQQSLHFAQDYELLNEGAEENAWLLFKRKWFLSALLFIQQRILIAPQQRAERHFRRRLERAGFTHEPLIRVVELRRKQARSEHHGDSEPVEWSHQWIVSGHWRQQWYPSLNANQPRWIMPYVKGPEDKPLKPPRAKVFAVVR